MFRNIGGAIENKIKGFTKNSEANDKLNRAFARFLAECFPEGKSWGFDVSILNSKITIQTANKAVANELILKAGELSRIFKEEGLMFDQIIIR